MTRNLSLPTYTKRCGSSQLAGPVAGLTYRQLSFCLRKVGFHTTMAVTSQPHGGEKFGPAGLGGSGAAISGQGRCLLAWKARLPGGPRTCKSLLRVPQKGQSFPRPFRPLSSRTMNHNGSGIKASMQPAVAHSGVSPPAPQLRGSDGLSARPSRRVGQDLSP